MEALREGTLWGPSSGSVQDEQSSNCTPGGDRVLVEFERELESVAAHTPAPVPATELTPPAAALIAASEWIPTPESPLASATLHHPLAEDLSHLLILVGDLGSGRRVARGCGGAGRGPAA